MTRQQDDRSQLATGASRGPAARALVCLDDAHDSGVLAAALREKDMAVVVSSSARDARDALAFGTPDVVVVEVRDGDGGVGAEVLEAAMAAGSLALAVAPLSALGGPSDELWARGIREVFHQPIDVQALAARIGAGFDGAAHTAGPSTRVAERAPHHEPDTVYSAPPAFDPASLGGAQGAASLGPTTIASPMTFEAEDLAPEAPEPPEAEQPEAEQSDVTTPEPASAAPPVEVMPPAPEIEAPAPQSTEPGDWEPPMEGDDPLGGGSVDSMMDQLMGGFDFDSIPLPEGMGLDPVPVQPPAPEPVAQPAPEARPEPQPVGAAETPVPMVPGPMEEPEGLVNPWDAIGDLDALTGPVSDVDAILASAGVSKPLFDPSAMATTEEPALPSEAFASQELPIPDAIASATPAADPPEGANEVEPEPQDMSTAKELPELDGEALGLTGDDEPPAADEDYDGPSTGEMLRASMPFWRRNPWVARAAIGALAAVLLGQVGYLAYGVFSGPSGTSPADGLVDSDAEKSESGEAADEAAVRPSDVPEVPTLEEEATKAYGEGVLAAKAGDLDAAARHYRHLLRKPVDHEGGMAGLSAVLIEQGHFGEAKKLLQQLAADKPEDPLVQLDLGLVANELDDNEAARQALKRYLELAPADHEHREDVMRLVLALDGKAAGT